MKTMTQKDETVRHYRSLLENPPGDNVVLYQQTIRICISCYATIGLSHAKHCRFYRDPPKVDRDDETTKRNDIRD